MLKEKNNIKLFQQVLTHFKIEHCIIHDSDERKDKDKWEENLSIWQRIVDTNEKVQVGLARRYVFVKAFEAEHPGKSATDYDKLRVAHEFAKTITEQNRKTMACYIYLNDWLGEQKILHDQTYIKEKLTEFTDTKAEGKRSEILETTLETA